MDPRVASIMYAADRFESSKEIRKWLHEGYTVLADRYVSANQIHQGGKIRSRAERKKFLQWLEKMEYGVFAIPKPDLVIYLDVPFEVSQYWLRQKVAKRKKTSYLKGGRRDVAEDNLVHLKDSRNSALSLYKQNKDWEKVQCCKGMFCMMAEQVHEHVFEIIKKRFKNLVK